MVFCPRRLAVMIFSLLLFCLWYVVVVFKGHIN